MRVYSKEKVLELEKKLQKIKKETKENTWKSCFGFDGYEINEMGVVKRKEKTISRLKPRGKNGEVQNFYYKEKIMRPLCVGVDQRWKGIKLNVEYNKPKQMSLAKLLASAFLEIDPKILPKFIFFLDGDSNNVILSNLTFLKRSFRED